MKKLNSCQLALILIGVFALSGAFFRYPPNTSEAVAAWVQAIGSVGAIFVAVWVMNQQYENTRRDDEAETRAFVQAIYDELENLWQGYIRDFAPLIQNLQEGQILDVIFPVGTDLFTIYNGSSSQVGKVPDPELRKLIVVVYGKAKGLIYSFKMNNELVRGHAATLADNHGPDRAAILEHQKATLRSYAPLLKYRDREITEKMEAFFAAAKSWLSKNN